MSTNLFGRCDADLRPDAGLSPEAESQPEVREGARWSAHLSGARIL